MEPTFMSTTESGMISYAAVTLPLRSNTALLFIEVFLCIQAFSGGLCFRFIGCNYYKSDRCETLSKALNRRSCGSPK